MKGMKLIKKETEVESELKKKNQNGAKGGNEMKMVLFGFCLDFGHKSLYF